MGNSNLFKKLLQLQKSVQGLQKDANGDKYMFLSGNKLLKNIRPTMDNLGLILTQEVTHVDYFKNEYPTSRGTKQEMFIKADMLFTWIDAESGESLPLKFVACGQNGWDKGLGSALTYAERYFIMKQLHLITDEDDIDYRIDEEAIRLPEPDEKTRQDAINTFAYGTTEQKQEWENYLKTCFTVDIEALKAEANKLINQ